MANNRLYLVDTETRRALLLANTTGTSWYVADETIARKLQDFFWGALDFEAQSGMPGSSDHSNLVIMTEYELPDDITR